MLASLARSLVVLVPVVAAVETLFARAAAPWRGLRPELFLQTLVLWTVFGLLALAPAWLTVRFIRHQREDRRAVPALEPLVLSGWMVAPVLLHAVLDRHTGLAGDLSGLRAARPWAEVALALFVLLGALVAVSAGLRRLRPRTVGLALLPVALVAGLIGGPHSAGSAAGKATPTPDRPNLLLLVWDTTRADRLQPYGHERETTPHLARFVEQAIVFENAVSPSVFTLSSHLSLLTGVHPSTHGARLLFPRYDPGRATSIAATLGAAGYRTGAFVGTDVLGGRTGIRHGFETYDDRTDPAVCDTRGWSLVHDVQSVLARLSPAFSNNGLPHWFQDFQRPARAVLTSALAWIERDDPRPWFCFVNLYDPHWPYLPQGAGRDLVAEYDGPLGPYLFRADDWVPGTELSADDLRHMKELYEGELFDLDREVDGFLAALALGSGGTAVLLTADHGEAFGEAGRWKHEDVTEPQVRVPFIVRLPEPTPAGRRVAGLVSGVDVTPTLLGLAGLELPPDLDGVDLLGPELLTDRIVLVEDRDHLDPLDVRVALYRGSWKLVRRGLGEEASFALYDLAQDAIGERDVSTEHPALHAELVELLTARRRAADLADAEAVIDLPGMVDALRALGYGGAED